MVGKLADAKEGQREKQSTNFMDKKLLKKSHILTTCFFLHTLTLFRGLWIPGRVTLSPFTPLTSRST